MKPHIKHDLVFFKSPTYLYLKFYMNFHRTLHHRTDVNRKHVKDTHLDEAQFSKFVLSLILYKTASIFKRIVRLQ